MNAHNHTNGAINTSEVVESMAETIEEFRMQCHAVAVGMAMAVDDHK